MDGIPKCIGVISAQQSKGSRIFGFEYDKDWLKSDQVFLLDPEIGLYGGTQYPNKKDNFGVFMDSMPDTWGRKLMLRRAAQTALAKGSETLKVSEGEHKEYLLGNDEAALLWMASLGCIEMNPWFSRSKLPDNPDYCVIDLDPDKNTFDEVIQVAQMVPHLQQNILMISRRWLQRSL